MNDWLEINLCVPGRAQKLHNEPVPKSLVSFEKSFYLAYSVVLFSLCLVCFFILGVGE